MVAIADHRRPARVATISALMVVASFVAAKAARDAILLSRFSIEMLPVFIGLAALLSLPVIIIAGRLMVRYGPARLVPAMNASSGLFALLEWALIGNYPRLIAVVVFFHLSIASAVLVSGFWSIVNERFDIHNAKKHIGGIGMGATLGGIVGGVIAERTGAYLAPDMILIVLAVMQLVCAIMLYAFGRGTRPHVEVEAAKEAGAWSALGEVARSKLLRKVGMIVMLTAIGAGAMDYVFKADIVGGSSKESLLRSLALFYTVTNVITAVIQVAVCGPIITRLGVPRSVGTMPLAITGFGLLALLVPVPLSATIARASELITRNSVYRAGYELLYAPLPNDQKRPTKVVLDVGADKLGDIFAAQLVGAIVFLVADVRSALLVATVIAGVLGILVALRLPKSYTKALEDSLMTAAAELPPVEAEPEPWITLSGMPGLGQPGDLVPLRLRNRKRQRRPVMLPAPLASPAPPVAPNGTDRLIELIGELRSGDLGKIQRALANPVPPEVALVAIELIGARDEVARAAFTALRLAAPRCTGLLVDAMLDASRDPIVRRRLPAIVCKGEPQLAAWGLWRGLGDSSFEVRYQCGAVLTPLAISGYLANVPQDEIYERVRNELVAGPEAWKARALVPDAVLEGREELHTDLGLAHVFRVLGFVLPAEPLRIALRAVQTEDPVLRGMALEYLESILPPDVHAQLWPLLDRTDVTAASLSDLDAAIEQPPKVKVAKLGHSPDALLERLNVSFEKLRHHG